MLFEGVVEEVVEGLQRAEGFGHLSYKILASDRAVGEVAAYGVVARFQKGNVFPIFRKSFRSRFQKIRTHLRIDFLEFRILYDLKIFLDVVIDVLPYCFQHLRGGTPEAAAYQRCAGLEMQVISRQLAFLSAKGIDVDAEMTFVGSFVG